MAAPTITDLRLLTGADIQEAPDDALTFFITQANVTISTHIQGTALNQQTIDQIHLYLAGHYYVLSVEGGGVTYRRAGQSEERFKSFGYEAIGFQTTRFGQMACALDTTGILSSLSVKDKTQFTFTSYSAARALNKLTGGST